ncbi:MAG: replication-associated recombination protein A [Verrucomicrobia bacterium]|nr:replication-associated recombination protein A [Verrucomicrobiota bacterium]
MADLFDLTETKSDATAHAAPLAERMRPRTLDEFAGQQHILGPGKLLRRAIEADRIASIILFGPPGTGKTTLAQIIANATKSRFERLSGVESNIADLRKVVASAANRLANTGQKTILFVDEIHRWNKAQQDVLLPDVERGTVRLIGATTENPFFYVNSALVSRSQVFQLEPLAPADIEAVLRRALADEERGVVAALKSGTGLRPVGVGQPGPAVHEHGQAGRPSDSDRRDVRPTVVVADANALTFLATIADGDARKALNALEIATLTTPPGADRIVRITHAIAEESIQKKAVVYDATGDGHYDTISAFIKSVRGSDPDAALYWLAKMLYAGEDIRFIARRLVILASEDIGMADPQGLPIAVAAQQAVQFIGMPEARITLAHATVYLATAPKSNRAYAAIDKAMEEVKSGVTLAVPRHLRSTGSKRAAKTLGHTGYQYSHEGEGAYIPQAYLPEGRRYYDPSENGYEKRVKERLDYWRSLFEQSQGK